MRAYYTHEQCTRALTIKGVERLQMGTDGAWCESDHHVSAGRRWEGTAWVALVLEEQTALGPLYIHLFHADRVILFAQFIAVCRSVKTL